MTRGSRTWRLAVAAVGGLLALAACGSSGALPSSGGSIPVGPGVTADTITLGVLTDLSGAFAVAGKAILQSSQLFWKDQNARGGVCGRRVQLLVQDHGYSVQTAVNLYAGMKDRVLAFQSLLGAPMTGALLPEIAADRLLTEPLTFSSQLLSNPYIVMAGTTYDLEMIDAVTWLMSQGLRAGDRVGHIYLEGAVGDNAVSGSRAAARQNGLTLVEQRVQPNQRDLTGQVQAIHSAGARFLLMNTTPPQAASAASVAEAQGYDLTIVGSSPTFVPSMLDGPARSALERHFRVVQSFGVFSSDAPGPSRLRAEYAATYPGTPLYGGAMYAYGQAEIMFRILDAACRSGSLTRPALLRSFQGLGRVETEGLILPLDYSRPGRPPARAVYIDQPDSASMGGLKVVQEPFAAPQALSYTP